MWMARLLVWWQTPFNITPPLLRLGEQHFPVPPLEHSRGADEPRKEELKRQHQISPRRKQRVAAREGPSMPRCWKRAGYQVEQSGVLQNSKSFAKYLLEGNGVPSEVLVSLALRRIRLAAATRPRELDPFTCWLRRGGLCGRTTGGRTGASAINVGVLLIFFIHIICSRFLRFLGCCNEVAENGTSVYCERGRCDRGDGNSRVGGYWQQRRGCG
mmetsp:Transcript_9057/g.22165  ORF Transcript_9057/g.22165 Transcript_9057/m.22165 type:complete len:214 (-) Transcript_9057:362-1003(-)